MLPLLAALLLPMQAPARQAPNDGHIALTTWGNAPQTCLFYLLDSNGRELLRQDMNNWGVYATIDGFRLMPGGKKVLAMTHAVPVASGPIITSQHIIDLDTKESPIIVCKDGAYQQGLFNGDGSGIFLTEKMKDPDSPRNYKFKSRYFDLKKKELSDLPLSWDKSILDVGSDGQFALIHTIGDRGRQGDYDIVSTKDWKSVGKAHKYSGGAKVSRDGRATLSIYHERDEKGPTLFRVPFQEKDRVSFKLPEEQFAHRVAFAPDGKRVLFSVYEYPDKYRATGGGVVLTQALYTANIDGSNLKLIHKFKGAEVISAIDWR